MGPSLELYCASEYASVAVVLQLLAAAVFLLVASVFPVALAVEIVVAHAVPVVAVPVVAVSAVAVPAVAVTVGAEVGDAPVDGKTGVEED